MHGMTNPFKSGTIWPCKFGWQAAMATQTAVEKVGNLSCACMDDCVAIDKQWKERKRETINPLA